MMTQFLCSFHYIVNTTPSSIIQFRKTIHHPTRIDFNTTHRHTTLIDTAKLYKPFGTFIIILMIQETHFKKKIHNNTDIFAMQ